jgi:DNA-directed RNA polymerase specialized sigma24 family protein
MTELVTPQPGGKSQVDQVKAFVEGKFGLWSGDSHDVVADALFSLCLAHARKPYRSLGPILQKAGVRRAAKWRRRSQRSCPLEREVPSCTRSADEMVRFESEDEILHGAICKEDESTQDIIYMHAIEGRRFGEIALLLNLTEDAARSKYNNARARLRKRLEATCGP